MSNLEKEEQSLLDEAIRLLRGQYGASEHFNQFMDGDEPISLPSPREDVGIYQYERSRVLFWLDRDAYEDERQAWENNNSQAKHKDALMLLREIGSTVPFRELLNAAERGRIVPFVGAGISKFIGMPLWGEALQELLRRLPGADAAGIGALIARGSYLDAAQALAEYDRIQTTNYIRTTYRAQQLNLAGPLLQLPRFAKGCVVTTNFDDAIELIYKQTAGEFSAYMHGTQEHNFFKRLVRGDRCLLKLHGDAENEATHILTGQQYADAYGGKFFDFRKPLPKALRQIFVSQSLLFIGCSLEQDWTLDLFRAAKAEDGYQLPDHYAILPALADRQAQQQKATQLLELNIQPLWYPQGQHDYVEKLLQLVVDVIEKRIAFND